MPDGTIHTFSRGGSDVTGSIVARAVGAELYENWTDVSGVLAADPRIIEHPHVVDYITYRELRELSYMGASVLHEDAVFPVRRANIPINIRNTNRPAGSRHLHRPDAPGQRAQAQGHRHRRAQGLQQRVRGKIHDERRDRLCGPSAADLR